MISFGENPFHRPLDGIRRKERLSAILPTINIPRYFDEYNPHALQISGDWKPGRTFMAVSSTLTFPPSR